MQNLDPIDQVCLWFILGKTRLEIEFLANDLVQADSIQPLIESARQKLVVVAAFDRDNEIVEQKRRLDEIYSAAMETGEDFGAANAAVRGIIELLGLKPKDEKYSTPKATTGGDPESERELDAIRAHLLPLKLAGEDYPLREHARIAAERIREFAGA